MNIFLPFFFGYLAAVVGVIPPGLINMTAAKVSLIEGKKIAFFFVLGALVIIFFQTYISVIFAQYINLHNEVIILLRKIGLVIFLLLSIYFFKFAKNPSFINPDHAVEKSKHSRFFKGMFVSAINFFPIPYYVLISITMASYGIFTFDTLPELSLVIGAVLGSSTIFYLYVVFFNKMKSKTDFFINNMNKIIGTITGIVALLTLFNLLK
ncbi:lysine transporter LysE [Flavobacterium sp.]|jgi:threonine/homoserine/homoserine lactone efflux protein|uniref:lysine transporter LysE n=1 Tax=Flavobacterium sp. TaxID=239 RepID=UPI003BBF9657